MLRMEETDEEVDFRPRRPAEDRLLYEPRGVIGDGDKEFRWLAWLVLNGLGWRGYEWRWFGYEVLLKARLLALDARLT